MGSGGVRVGARVRLANPTTLALTLALGLALALALALDLDLGLALGLTWGCVTRAWSRVRCLLPSGVCRGRIGSCARLVRVRVRARVRVRVRVRARAKVRVRARVRVRHWVRGRARARVRPLRSPVCLMRAHSSLCSPG